MRYTVTWVPSAEKELARIWLRTTKRQAVANAANRIDLLLKDPSALHQQKPGMRQRLTILPLSIIFDVQPDDCRVRVLQVRFLG